MWDMNKSRWHLFVRALILKGEFKGGRERGREGEKEGGHVPIRIFRMVRWWPFWRISSSFNCPLAASASLFSFRFRSLACGPSEEEEEEEVVEEKRRYREKGEEEAIKKRRWA